MPRTQQNSSKIETCIYRFTKWHYSSHAIALASFCIAITIISIKWLSNNYIIKSFYFFRATAAAAVCFLLLYSVALCCRHLYACRQLNARNVRSLEVDWLTQQQQQWLTGASDRTPIGEKTRNTNIQISYLSRALDHYPNRIHLHLHSNEWRMAKWARAQTIRLY